MDGKHHRTTTGMQNEQPNLTPLMRTTLAVGLKPHPWRRRFSQGLNDLSALRLNVNFRSMLQDAFLGDTTTPCHCWLHNEEPKVLKEHPSSHGHRDTNLHGNYKIAPGGVARHYDQASVDLSGDTPKSTGYLVAKSFTRDDDIGPASRSKTLVPVASAAMPCGRKSGNLTFVCRLQLARPPAPEVPSSAFTQFTWDAVASRSSRTQAPPTRTPADSSVGFGQGTFDNSGGRQADFGRPQRPAAATDQRHDGSQAVRGPERSAAEASNDRCSLVSVSTKMGLPSRRNARTLPLLHESAGESLASEPRRQNRAVRVRRSNQGPPRLESHDIRRRPGRPV